ncbi:hypothetical protein [Nonomuraea sp. PA05]|uniref:hypothetical protein n=1 Tax=Nonomuraea sp. PA05 TaxID=2604466 RepID=UPI001CA340D5|nr:hypothetical protein [Nonomuraea sp. PA05]
MTIAEKHEFPMARACPFVPPLAYAEIREEESVSRVRLPDNGWAWVVSRHEDVRTVLNDRRFSTDRQHPDFPQLVKSGARGRCRRRGAPRERGRSGGPGTRDPPTSS